MGFKRKRSLTTLTSSPSSTASTTVDSLHSPPHVHHISLFGTSTPNGVQDYTTYSPPEPYFAAGMAQDSSPAPSFEINPKHMHSRTRKRFRDDRPDEEAIGKKTINLLFNAQRELKLSAVDSDMAMQSNAGYDDMTGNENDEIDMDNAMIDHDPSSSTMNDGMHQTSLAFPVIHNDYGLPSTTRMRTPSLASSTATSSTSPFSQPKQLQQKSLLSFFGGDGSAAKLHEHQQHQQHQQQELSSSSSSSIHQGNGHWQQSQDQEMELDGHNEFEGRTWVGGIGWV